jgi:hypothetical protein
MDNRHITVPMTTPRTCNRDTSSVGHPSPGIGRGRPPPPPTFSQKQI